MEILEKSFAISYIEEKASSLNPVTLIINNDKVYLSEYVIDENGNLKEENKEVNINEIIDNYNKNFNINLSADKFENHLKEYLNNKQQYTKDKTLLTSYFNNIFLSNDTIYGNLSNFLRSANFLDKIKNSNKNELIEKFNIDSVNIEEVQKQIKEFYNFDSFESFYYFNNAYNATRFLKESLEKLNENNEVMALIRDNQILRFEKYINFDKIIDKDIHFIFSMDTENYGKIFAKSPVPLNKKLQEATMQQNNSQKISM